MRVLGIDPGYAIVGWGVVEYAGNRFAPIAYGAVCTDKDTPFEQRLIEIYDGIKDICTRYQPEALSIEKLYYQHNQTTVIGVAEARGVILLAAAQCGVPIYENTKKIVEYLANHPQVEKVNHPSLPDHPDHALYQKYFPNGGASIFTFQIKGGVKEAHAFIDHLKIFSLLANVADVKSLVIHPATTTHSQLSEQELLDQGIYQNTIRLSIGTENADDLIADLEQAFQAVKE